MILKTSVTFISLTIGQCLFSQFGKTTISDDIPKSVSVTDVEVFDPNFDNSFLFLKSFGATIFKQSTELSVVDAKTLKIKKSIEFPVFEGYGIELLNIDQSYPVKNTYLITLDKSFLMFYSTKQKKNKSLAVISLDESLKVPKKLTTLFPISDNANLQISINDKKDIFVIQYGINDKKIDKSGFYYYVYNKNLELLKSDSLIDKYNQLLFNKVYAYENGVVFFNERKVNIFDLKNNRTGQFTLPLKKEKDILYTKKVKAIVNDKVIFFGNYYYNLDKSSLQNGYFKLEFDFKTLTLENEIYYNHIEEGKDEKKYQVKNFENPIITESGACYAIVSQTKTYTDNNNNKTYYSSKYELICIQSNNSKWKKQLPIFDGSSGKISINNKGDTLYISYLNKGKTDKIDYNKYIFGENKIEKASIGGAGYTNLSILRILPGGFIEHQNINDIRFIYLCNFDFGFIAINRDDNGFTYNNCKFIKMELIKN